MNIYKISQTLNRDYDTYGGFVVYAKDKEAARDMGPATKNGKVDWEQEHLKYCWVKKREDVIVEFIGVAVDRAEPGVILTSFRAG